MNKSGQMAGEGQPDCQNSFTIAVRWAASGVIAAEGKAVGVELNYGRGINDLGEVVGVLWGEGPPCGDLSDAFLWVPPARPQALAQLSGVCGQHLSSEAFGISGAHQVVGAREVRRGGASHAFVWTRAAGFQDLGTLPGGTRSQANDINNHQQVVGWSSNSGGTIHATLWKLR